MTKLSMSEEEMLKRKYTRPYEKRIAELEKENAELNNFIMQSKKDGISPINALIIKNLGNQLIEAKEIIKGLLSFVDSLGNYSGGIFAKAERFISEVEK